MDLINAIKEIDTRLFLTINGTHSEAFDWIMWWVSHRFVWIPLYIFFAWLVVRTYGRYSILILLGATLLVVATDQISVHFFKNFFLRYRPCHNLDIKQLVHVNGDCGGQYGFISSHAANVSGVAAYMFLLFRNRYRFFGAALFSWAALVCYSRIYNGVHYPADVLAGALLGVLVASLVWLALERMIRIKSVLK